MNILYEVLCKNVHTFMKQNIWTPRVFLIFFTFFERILYKSNCLIFIFSWCGTHTKIRSKLVVIVMAGSQKITLWGPQGTPLGILRVNQIHIISLTKVCGWDVWLDDNQKMNTKFISETWREDTFGILPYLGVDVRVIFEWILEKQCLRLWNVECSQVAHNGVHLVQGISWSTEWPPTTQK